MFVKARMLFRSAPKSVHHRPHVNPSIFNDASITSEKSLLGNRFLSTYDKRWNSLDLPTTTTSVKTFMPVSTQNQLPEKIRTFEDLSQTVAILSQDNCEIDELTVCSSVQELFKFVVSDPFNRLKYSFDLVISIYKILSSNVLKSSNEMLQTECLIFTRFLIKNELWFLEDEFRWEPTKQKQKEFNGGIF